MEDEMEGMANVYGCANSQLSYLIVLAGAIIVSFGLGFLVAWFIYGG